MKEALIKLPFGKSSYLALWKKTSDQSKKGRNVLLTHGTFSNKKVLNGIAEYLATQGYTCWTFEWRNHGSSAKMEEKFNFETIAKEDFAIVFQYLFEVERIETIDCVTHSGGGICLTIALITKPIFQSKIGRIAMFGCQSFGAGDAMLNYWGIWLHKIVAKSIGYIPARKVGSEENEPYSLMQQWYDWNLSGKFIGANGVDYQAKMKMVKTPILSIFGKGDTFIAPPSGCQKFVAAFENPSNKALLCSKEDGYAEDYNHSRILHSRNASKEIYPKVLEWFENN